MKAIVARRREDTLKKGVAGLRARSINYKGSREEKTTLKEKGHVCGKQSVAAIPRGTQ